MTDDRSLEPGVLERKRLRPCLLEADPRALRPSLCQHLRGRVDPPDLPAPLCERGRKGAGAAAGVECPAAGEISFLDEELEKLPPLRVHRPQPVVRLRELAEVLRDGVSVRQ